MTDIPSQPRGDTSSRIEFLTQVQAISFPDEWYEANSEEHFWFQWRARTATAHVNSAAKKTINRMDLSIGQTELTLVPIELTHVGAIGAYACRCDRSNAARCDRACRASVQSD